MFIASRPAGDSQAPEERHVSIGVGLTGQASRPRNMPLLRSLAGGSGCFYNHGAPNGAFRFADSTAPGLKDSCKVQRGRAHSTGGDAGSA